MVPFFMDKVEPVIKQPEITENRTPIYRQEREKKPIKEMGIGEKILVSETPIDVFEEENHQPYISDILNLDYSIAKEEMNLIDDYIKEEILINEEKPSIKTYAKHYQQIAKKLGLENTTSELIVEKLASFIRKFNLYKNQMERNLRKRIFKRMMIQAEMEISENLFKEMDIEHKERYLKKQNLWE